MGFTVKNVNIDLIELNEGQLSKIDPETNKQIGLPRNPRFIRDARFEALKKSIEDAPEMLDLREVMLYSLSEIKGKDGKYIAVGGNMRVRACRELGYQEVPCKVLDPNTPMEKLREYAIKDNGAFGQNDFDILANEWDSEELQEWGMDNEYIIKDNEWDSLDLIEEEQEPPSLDKDVKIEITVPSEQKELEEEIKAAVKQALLPYDGVKVK